MRSADQVRQELARAGTLLAACFATWFLASLPPSEPELRFALLALGVSFAIGLLLPPRLQGKSLQIGLLASDLVAAGVVGYVLVKANMPGGSASTAFLTGYVVAVLVAVVGSRVGTAWLAALGGTMVIAVGTAFSVTSEWTLQPAAVGAQIALVAAVTVQIVLTIGAMRERANEKEMTRLVEREIKSREAAANELVSFTQALADSSSLEDIANAVLRHLRCHTNLSVRAVVLESEGDDIAVWEEAGRLGIEHVERRRVRLQESLSRSGSSFVVPRLQCHSTGMSDVPLAAEYRTAVDIPVRAGDRTAGVLFLADPQHGALPPDRISVLVDIARRTSEAIRRLEKIRDHENRRTALLLRQMREGVLLLGRDGQVLLANPSARRALEGCATVEDEARPDHPPALGELTLAELADTPPGVSRRFRASFPDQGRETPVQLACTAICVLDRGRRIGTLVTLTDVTEEELARNRIVQAEKMTLVGQTLAGVAHELNNPLAALIGYADLLGAQPLDAAIEKPIQQMREQAHRATRIVRNLLNFARRRNPERTPILVTELIGATVELFAYEARMGGVEMKVEIPDVLPRVLADKHALQQVLVNLVQNALHALESWSGSRVLTIRVIEEENCIVVAVSDTGPGVPKELRSRVFESFFTTKGSSKGTGLGLALSRGIARDHGGDLILASGHGGGACFSMRLPRHVAGRGAMHVAAGGSDVEYPIPERVLVVDDEPSVRETLVAQLGAMGARVDSAGNVPEALRLATTNRYDAIITDIRMPGSTGLDLHRELQQSNPLGADRVVFITGDFVNDELLRQALDTGRLLLEKPFTMRELAAALGKTVSGPLEYGLSRLSA
ncbi:MAG: ATP-binding protein [Planctomycetota bacterium]|nr:ATP-binding protein [Planctomycetota bacterium]